MSEQKITAEEAFESLTGFEEIAVEKKFGTDIESLAVDKPIRLLRALSFVFFKREGMDDAKAYHAAMSQTLTEAQERFADAEDMAEALEAGEGDTPSA